MNKREVDQANLYAKQVVPKDVPKVNLLLQQEDRRMLKADVVDRIHEVSDQGIEVDLRTLQRVIAPLRQTARAKALATVRFETKPGEQM